MKKKLTLWVEQDRIVKLKHVALNKGVSLSDYLTTEGLKDNKVDSDKLEDLVLDRKLENQWTINDLIMLKINEIIRIIRK